MKTTPFRKVWDRTVRYLGLNARKQYEPDLREALTDRINDRVRTIWTGWSWPEWEITEERAFRPIWNAGGKYKSKGTDRSGFPDEVFYLGSPYQVNDTFGTGFGYYRVLAAPPSDPPIGTVPTNATYWEKMTTVDTFIAYDQRDARPIGEVLAAYSRNPRVPTGSRCWEIKYDPSELGIDVRAGGLNSVFLTYKMPCPEYTMLPYVVGRVYDRGDIVFSASLGDCYQAITVTTGVPGDYVNNDDWILVPFLEKWEGYVVNGAYADSLMESNPGGNEDIQSRAYLCQQAEQRATDALQQEVDALTAQGQRLQWNFRHHRRHYHNSQSNIETVTLINE